MSFKEGSICRFCLTSSDCFDSVEEVTRNMLNSLSLKLNLTISDQPVMCKTCAEMLQTSFDFKYTCLFTQSQIEPFIRYNDIKNVDMDTVYLKLDSDSTNSIPDDYGVCRFCIQLAKSEDSVALNCEEKHVTLVKVTLQNYFPEVNINITKNPIMCSKCYESICVHFDFVTNCLDTEEKIKKYCEVEGTTSKENVKLASVVEFLEKNNITDDGNVNEVKNFCKIETKEAQDVDKNFMDIETHEVYIKEEMKEEPHEYESISDTEQKHNPSDSALHTDKEYTIITNPKTNHKSQPPQDDDTEAKPYKCDICTYKTKHRHILRRHSLIHKDASEVTMYRCDECIFETKLKFVLKEHQLIHKDPSEVTMFKCDTCPYETKFKSRLREHMIVHRDMSMVTMYKCELCSHMTKYKSSLTKHMLVHKDKSELTMFVCEICGQKLKYKSELKTHVLFHKDASEIPMYKCAKCNYETKYKRALKRHILLKHTDPSLMTMYKCEVCGFETRYRSNLNKHLLTHRT